MTRTDILNKYCLDASEPTKADVDNYFKNEREFNILAGKTDGRVSKNSAKGFLDKLKKLYMDFVKNGPKIKAMVDKRMLGPFIDDFNRLKNRWMGQYNFASRFFVAAMNGKDTDKVNLYIKR